MEITKEAIYAAVCEAVVANTNVDPRNMTCAKRGRVKQASADAVARYAPEVAELVNKIVEEAYEASIIAGVVTN